MAKVFCLQQKLEKGRGGVARNAPIAVIADVARESEKQRLTTDLH
jgi:hypothetical protein